MVYLKFWSVIPFTFLLLKLLNQFILKNSSIFSMNVLCTQCECKLMSFSSCLCSNFVFTNVIFFQFKLLSQQPAEFWSCVYLTFARPLLWSINGSLNPILSKFYEAFELKSAKQYFNFLFFSLFWFSFLNFLLNDKNSCVNHVKSCFDIEILILWSVEIYFWLLWALFIFGISFSNFLVLCRENLLLLFLKLGFD